MKDMLLAALITAGSIGLLVAMGWLADNLLGKQADRWAKTLVNKDNLDGEGRERA